MKIKETMNQIRKRQKELFTLRVRMIFLVQMELIASIVLAFLFDMLLEHLWPDNPIPVIFEFLLVSLVLGTVATFFVSKLFFNPLKELRRAMDRVSEGDFTVRLEPDKHTALEIQEIYAGFNLMTHALSATEVLQTDFVSNVSHEFKTPINAIEGYATLLQAHDAPSGTERGEYVEKILFNTRRLSNLVGNILLLSRIDSQAIQPQRTLYRLDEQIRQSLLLLETEWVKKDIEFDVEMDDTLYNGPENLMHHVWHNLLSNAIKFDPQGGLIRIRLFSHENQVLFTIEDNGPGIPEETLKHIFDKFYQGDTSHKQEGNGLGLALVKKIVLLSGGTITAENLPNGGCRFIVMLKT